jgi:2-polyprenyl-3-methyl-5-hydroxy-6-metoxy-1,4-benzoquinol methylase
VTTASHDGGRSRERLRVHYEVERELSDRLRHSTRDERLTLYSAVYDELFRRITDHPMLTRKVDDATRAAGVEEQLRVLRPLLRRGARFVEIGAGDCALSHAVAALGTEVLAIDVSEEILRGGPWPANLTVRVCDGISVPAPDAWADVVYSNQVMEHLHPDDASEQLREIARVLKPGGVYVCITPNRLNGPHDISHYFDESATGFHLREYTTGELARLFRRSGFHEVGAIVGAKGRFTRVPAFPIGALESVLGVLPGPLRRSLARGPLFRWLLGVRVCAVR